MKIQIAKASSSAYGQSYRSLYILICVLEQYINVRFLTHLEHRSQVKEHGGKIIDWYHTSVELVTSPLILEMKLVENGRTRETTWNAIFLRLSCGSIPSCPIGSITYFMMPQEWINISCIVVDILYHGNITKNMWLIYIKYYYYKLYKYYKCFIIWLLWKSCWANWMFAATYTNIYT